MDRYMTLRKHLQYNEEAGGAVATIFAFFAGAFAFLSKHHVKVELLAVFYGVFFPSKNVVSLSEQFKNHLQENDIKEIDNLNMYLTIPKTEIGNLNESQMNKIDEIYSQLNAKFGMHEGWITTRANYMEFKNAVNSILINRLHHDNSDSEAPHDNNHPVSQNKNYLYMCLLGLLTIGIGFIYYDLKKGKAKAESAISWTKNLYIRESESFGGFLFNIFKKAIEFFKKILDNKYGLITVGVFVFCLGIYFLYTNLVTNKI